LAIISPKIEAFALQNHMDMTPVNVVSFVGSPGEDIANALMERRIFGVR
jgi:hypothetical protein